MGQSYQKPETEQFFATDIGKSHHGHECPCTDMMMTPVRHSFSPQNQHYCAACCASPKVTVGLFWGHGPLPGCFWPSMLPLSRWGPSQHYFGNEVLVHSEDIQCDAFGACRSAIFWYFWIGILIFFNFLNWNPPQLLFFFSFETYLQVVKLTLWT